MDSILWNSIYSRMNFHWFWGDDVCLPSTKDPAQKYWSLLFRAMTGLRIWWNTFTHRVSQEVAFIFLDEFFFVRAQWITGLSWAFIPTGSEGSPEVAEDVMVRFRSLQSSYDLTQFGSRMGSDNFKAEPSMARLMWISVSSLFSSPSQGLGSEC